MAQRHLSRRIPVPTQWDFSWSSALPAWLVPGQYIDPGFYRKVLGSYSLTFLTFPHIYNTALVGTDKGQPLHRPPHKPSLLPPQLNII